MVIVLSGRDDAGMDCAVLTEVEGVLTVQVMAWAGGRHGKRFGRQHCLPAKGLEFATITLSLEQDSNPSDAQTDIVVNAGEWWQ